MSTINNFKKNFVLQSKKSTLKSRNYLDFIQNIQTSQQKAQNDIILNLKDHRMIRIEDIIKQVASSNIPILITGESGSGKKHIANIIHNNSYKGETSQFIYIDCQSENSINIDLKLFGNNKYSNENQEISGAFNNKKKKTLVIDNITFLDSHLQTKLLKTLQNKESYNKLATKLIAITNPNIIDYVAQGKFRHDLYYRLYVLHIDIPPLRERPKDIVFLTKFFIRETLKRFKILKTIEISDAALNKLISYKWPDNIRELKQAIENAIQDSNFENINDTHIFNKPCSSYDKPTWTMKLPVGETLKSLETHFILETLKKYQGNRTHAANTLGISLRTLRNKINEFVTKGYQVTPPKAKSAS